MKCLEAIAFCKKEDRTQEYCRQKSRVNSNRLAVAANVVQSTLSERIELFATIGEIGSTDAPQRWILDSGATSHVTGNKASLMDFVSAEHVVNIADGRSIISPGFGSVNFGTRDGVTVTLQTFVSYLALPRA